MKRIKMVSNETKPSTLGECQFCSGEESNKKKEKTGIYSVVWFAIALPDVTYKLRMCRSHWWQFQDQIKGLK